VYSGKRGLGALPPKKFPPSFLLNPIGLQKQKAGACATRLCLFEQVLFATTSRSSGEEEESEATGGIPGNIGLSAGVSFATEPF
jgi:hypothetical protein